MLSALYDFFFNVVFVPGTQDGLYTLYQSQLSVFGTTITLRRYLCVLASTITLIIIVVLCFLFVWKMVKLVGNLVK